MDSEIQKIEFNNEILLGCLLDVSGSMKSFYEDLKNKNIEYRRIQTVFKTFLTLFQDNINYQKAHVFSILFGTNNKTSDLIKIFLCLADDLQGEMKFDDINFDDLNFDDDFMDYDNYDFIDDNEKLGVIKDYSDYYKLHELFKFKQMRNKDKLINFFLENGLMTKFIIDILQDDSNMETFLNMLPNIFCSDIESNNYIPDMINLLENKHGCRNIKDYINKYLTSNDVNDIYLMIYDDKILTMNIINILPFEYRPASEMYLVEIFDSFFGISSKKRKINKIVCFFTDDKPKQYVKDIRNKAKQLVQKKLNYEFKQIKNFLIEKLKNLLKDENYFKKLNDTNFFEKLKNTNFFQKLYFQKFEKKSEDISIHHNEENLEKIVNLLKSENYVNEGLVSKFINYHFYGDTPLYKTIKLTYNLLNFKTNINKFLIILSDGEPTDGDPSYIAEDIKKLGTIISTIFISKDEIKNPRSLFDKNVSNWSKESNLMFNMSSMIENEFSTVTTILEDEGWTIPSSGKYKLFLNANHPEIINEFNRCIKHIFVHDALINLIGEINLKEYIGLINSNFKVTLQIGGTCYAHSVATVIHLALSRIKGRHVPDFQEIKDSLVTEFGSNGANTEKVLENKCPIYKLKYQEVNEEGARKALQRKRPLVAKFRLSGDGWYSFSKFFENNPKGILTADDLLLKDPNKNKVEGGHAVVLVRCDSECLTFINSWGENFTNKGFFSVKNHKVLNLKFYDIFWTLDQLSKDEIRAYEAYKLDQSNKIINKISKLSFSCPICSKKSNIEDYEEKSLGNGICPNCKNEFDVGLTNEAYSFLRNFYKRTFY